MTTQMEIKPQVSRVQDQHKKPSVGATIGGVAAGWVTNNLLSQAPVKLYSPGAMEKMANLSSNLSADEFTQATKAIEDTVKTTGLVDKGVEIFKGSNANVDQVKDIMSQELNKGFAKYYPKQYKEMLAESSVEQVLNGNNAFYAMQSKKLVLPERGMELAGFHEIGHALNANMGKFGKILQKARGLSVLVFPIALISLIKTKKAPNEKSEGALDKTTTFIKNNAGKLTFAAFTPVLLEEGLATIKGNKLARNTLTADLAKKVAKSNMLGFSTYLALATMSAVGIWLANKVKDKIAQPKPNASTVS
ncbi:hypothetical protein IJC60_02120 [bacterium]|nr:hypothetical protein [bacterium]